MLVAVQRKVEVPIAFSRKSNGEPLCSSQQSLFSIKQIGSILAAFWAVAENIKAALSFSVVNIQQAFNSILDKSLRWLIRRGVWCWFFNFLKHWLIYFPPLSSFFQVYWDVIDKIVIYLKCTRWWFDTLLLSWLIRSLKETQVNIFNN